MNSEKVVNQCGVDNDEDGSTEEYFERMLMEIPDVPDPKPKKRRRKWLKSLKIKR